MAGITHANTSSRKRENHTSRFAHITVNAIAFTSRNLSSGLSYGPAVDLASDRKKYHKFSSNLKGCLRAKRQPQHCLLADCLENVGTLTLHNSMDLHGLLLGHFTFTTFTLYFSCIDPLFLCRIYLLPSRSLHVFIFVFTAAISW
jgi:hypothetical protein